MDIPSALVLDNYLLDEDMPKKKSMCYAESSFKFHYNNLRRIPGPHRRPPGAHATGDVNRKPALAVKPVVIAFVNEFSQIPERKKLTGMAVS